MRLTSETDFRRYDSINAVLLLLEHLEFKFVNIDYVSLEETREFVVRMRVYDVEQT